MGERESKKACKSARGQAAALPLPALSKMDRITFIEELRYVIFFRNSPSLEIFGNTLQDLRSFLRAGG